MTLVIQIAIHYHRLGETDLSPAKRDNRNEAEGKEVPTLNRDNYTRVIDIRLVFNI